MVRTCIFLTFALAACGGDDPKDVLIAPMALTGMAFAHGAPVPTMAQVELGKMLFFDPRLSANGGMSCSTCHKPELAWTDGLPLSPKFDGSVNSRNTPTVMNVGYLEKLYWDGRTPNLEANILAAWKGQMGGKPDEMAAALAEVAGYRTAFQEAFGAAPTGENIVAGLAAFLRTLRTGNSAFDRWRQGDQGAAGNDVQLGYQLFMGKAGCSVCHQPPLFTDRTFHVTGIGLDKDPPDLGAGAENALNDPKLRGAFKTPTLRNVALTGPYFHDGRAATLEEAVRIMVGGGLPIEDGSSTKDVALQDRKLSDTEIRQLIAFLEALTDVPPFVPPQVP